jgi:hypothetical protein
MRSGTEWLIGLLELNFHGELGKPRKRYVSKAGHSFVHSKAARFNPLGFNNIYIVRDGRDVITACYHYWLNKGTPRYKVSDTIKKHNISFSQFLRGETPTNEIKGRIEHVSDPVCHWVDHTQWVYYAHTVRYEDLKEKLHETLLEISEEFNKPLVYPEPKKLDKLVGVKPRKGVVGDWKNHFSEADLEYFWQKAGHRMLELGYKK